MKRTHHLPPLLLSPLPFLLYNLLFIQTFTRFPFIFCFHDAAGWYKNCRNLFSCGGGINTTVDYPFWGGDRPRECGHPGLELTCEHNNTPAILEIMGVKYRVFEIDPNSQILRISRQDFAANDICPDEFVNTTLDLNLFEYTAGYVNLTIQYGCPPLNIQIPKLLTCTVNGTTYQNGYIVPGAQGPGLCGASVFFPIHSTSFGVIKEFPDLGQLINRGFEVRWKVDGARCNECKDSGGSCGYDLKSNQFTCLCPSAQFSGSSACTSTVLSDEDRSSAHLSTLSSGE